MSGEEKLETIQFQCSNTEQCDKDKESCPLVEEICNLIVKKGLHPEVECKPASYSVIPWKVYVKKGEDDNEK